MFTDSNMISSDFIRSVRLGGVLPAFFFCFIVIFLVLAVENYGSHCFLFPMVVYTGVLFSVTCISSYVTECDDID